MPKVKRITMNILKPRSPSSLEFAKAIADQESPCRVQLTVDEVDEKTESITLVIEGEDIPFDAITETIQNLGGSLHSIDEVEVEGSGTSPRQE